MPWFLTQEFMDILSLFLLNKSQYFGYFLENSILEFILVKLKVWIVNINYRIPCELQICIILLLISS